MTTHDPVEEYFDNVKQALAEVFRASENIISERWRDEDTFIADQMDLVKASYAAGYLDALDDLRTKAGELEQTLDDRWEDG